MSNINEINPQQERLFEPEHLDYRQEVSLIDGYEVPVTYGKDGSYVDTVRRAGNLVLALDSMSQRNIREGFSVAPYTEPYSAPIYERYRDATPQVVDGASRNRNKYQNQLRQSFWAATGYSALKASGLMPARIANPRAQKMWRDFNEAYGHPTKLKERNSYKKQLQVQVDAARDVQLKMVA